METNVLLLLSRHPFCCTYRQSHLISRRNIKSVDPLTVGKKSVRAVSPRYQGLKAT